LIIVCSFVLFNYAIVFLSFDLRYIFKLFLVPTGTPTKHNKYVSNQKLEHFMSVSENFLIASGVFVLSTKYYLSLPKTMYLYLQTRLY